MIVYNLTDKTPPWCREARRAFKVKVAGEVIEPGQRLTIADHRLQPRDVAGLISDGVISLDVLPSWYVEEKMKGRKSRKKARP